MKQFSSSEQSVYSLCFVTTQVYLCLLPHRGCWRAITNPMPPHQKGDETTARESENPARASDKRNKELRDCFISIIEGPPENKYSLFPMPR